MYKRNILLLYVLFTLVISLNASSVFADVVTLSWNAPTVNADGTPLTDLAGYKVYYGTFGNYSKFIDVGNVTTYIANLSDGTYYFGVTAYDTSGNESSYSNKVNKTIRAVQQYTLSLNKMGTGSGTITSSPVGINCSSDCSEAYNAGTVVTLTALPDTSSTFTGWSGGGCNGTGQCVITLNGNLTVSASFTASENVSGNVAVYEDAEDGTIKGWDVYDNSPAGANITNVYDYDRMSRVTQLTGSGWDNGYVLRKDDGSIWNNSSQFVIEWSMKYSEYFNVYIDVETIAGHRYIYYTPDDYNDLDQGEYVHHGLGSGVIDGKWHTFVRDLQADLQEAQPGVTILKVNGFLIRGSGRVDDIKLSNKMISLTDFTYISDLQWIGTPVNGWGPIEIDKSNRGSAAGDGRTITLNGVSYTEGLGVHANSEIRYNLGGEYSSFISDIGVDDEVGNMGSVVFQLWADGIKIYDSGIMTGSSATKKVDVDVTGKNELKLIVTNAGDNINYDHADWAGACIW